MNIVIIKYNAGNVASVQFALGRAGIVATVSDNAEVIRAADKIIFPGVGEASSAMQSLKAGKLDELILQLKQPVLGICLGMQLMCEYSEEGDTKGLGLFRANVRRIAKPGEEGEMKIPHMGWNTIRLPAFDGAGPGLSRAAPSDNYSKLYKGVPQDTYVYYVHSYCADISADTTAVTEYIRPFSASLERDNFYGVQYHPEKSGVGGELIIRNFLDL